MEKCKHESDCNPYTREMFKEAFDDKYFSKSVCLQKESKFIRLEQGKMTVSEYGLSSRGFLGLLQHLSLMRQVEHKCFRMD